jgi:hypothetical protein
MIPDPQHDQAGDQRSGRVEQRIQGRDDAAEGQQLR